MREGKEFAVFPGSGSVHFCICCDSEKALYLVFAWNVSCLFLELVEVESILHLQRFGVFLIVYVNVAENFDCQYLWQGEGTEMRDLHLIQEEQD